MTDAELAARTYVSGIDRTLISAQLSRSPEARIDFIASLANFVDELQSRRGGVEFDPNPLLALLARRGVDLVLVGGLAAAAHGSPRATFDVDIAYRRDRNNLVCLVAALRDAEATPRGAFDEETLARGLNFTFQTRFGALDILGEPAGAPPYPQLRGAATLVEIRGSTIRVASLDHVVAMKEAAGRPHDKATAAELRAISDELRSA